MQNWHCRIMPSWVSHLFMRIPSDLLNKAKPRHVWGTYYSSFGYPLKGFTLHSIMYRFERYFSKRGAQNDPEWSAMWTLLKGTQILYPKNLHNVHPKWRSTHTYLTTMPHHFSKTIEFTPYGRHPNPVPQDPAQCASQITKYAVVAYMQLSYTGL